MKWEEGSGAIRLGGQEGQLRPRSCIQKLEEDDEAGEQRRVLPSRDRERERGGRGASIE